MYNYTKLKKYGIQSYTILKFLLKSSKLHKYENLIAFA